jgi:hypothetical protein
MKRIFHGLIRGGRITAALALTLAPAHAVDLPAPYTFEAGPLGMLA